MAEGKQEGRALYWLEDHVVTDVSYDLSTELAWQLLWDQARKLPKADIEELHQDYGKKGVRSQDRSTSLAPFSKEGPSGKSVPGSKPGSFDKPGLFGKPGSFLQTRPIWQ